MKLLLVSDLHYALKQFDWIVSVAPDFDVVVIAGDHLDISGQLDGSVQIVVILKYLKRLAAETTLIVSSGNHDLDQRDAAGEKVASWMNRVRQQGIRTDGDSISLDGVLITICPWWDGPRMKAAVQTQLETDAAKPRDAWFWVYHAPPDGSPTSWGGSRHYGDADVVGWIEAFKPDVVLCGHIHQAPFKTGGSWIDQIGSTWVFNSGQQIGPTPAHIMIDTDAREAAWFSLAGAELARLDAPLQRPVPDLTTLPAWLAPSQ